MPTFSSLTQNLLLSSKRGTVPDAHRERCLQRIGELNEEIRAVKSSYNSVSSACSLPPEILSEIFLQTRALAKDLRSWLGVSHVCREWRDVSLACLTLWSVLDFSNPNITNLMLERSKPGYLHISFDGGGPYNQGLLKALQDKDRILSVKLREPLGFDTASFRFCLNMWTDAPALEDLSLEGGKCFQGNEVHLPAGFLHGGAPALKRLDFIDLPWANLRDVVAPNIRHLCFGFTSWEDDFPLPTVEDLFRVLPQFKLIEVLDLVNCIPPDTHMPSALASAVLQSQDSQLELPFLRQLNLTDRATHALNFFKRIRVPPDVSVKVRVKSVDRQPYDVAVIEQLLHDLCRRPRCQLEALEQGNTFKLFMDEFSDPSPDADYDSLLVLRLEDPTTLHQSNPTIAIEIEDMDQGVDVVLQILGHQVDFCNLGHLAVVNIHDTRMAREHWGTIFGDLSRLTTVELSSEVGTRGIREALMEWEASRGDEEQARILFPTLSTLIISREEGGTAWAPGEVIVQILTVRAKAGYPLRRVVVGEGVSFPKGCEIRLKESTPGLEVEWR